MKLREYPTELQPYVFHGVPIDWEKGQKECLVECTFCEKNKLYIDSTTGKFSCKSCGAEGNKWEFLRMLHDLSWESTTDEQYTELAESRGLEDIQAMSDWLLAVNYITGEWMLPAFNAVRKITNIYRLATINGKERFLSTPGSVHQLFGPYDHAKSSILICEGPWDGLFLTQEMKRYRESGGKFVRTAKEELSLYAEANVLAVSGCEVFRDDWVPMMKGKLVYLLYDNDHPRTHAKTGKELPPQGLNGMRRATNVLHGGGVPVDNLNSIHWSEEGYDLELEDGYDVSDWFSDGHTLPDLMTLLQPVPTEWFSGGDDASDDPEEEWIPLLDCESFEELEETWSQALEWTVSLRHTLIVMLATVTSTRLQGDQIFLRVIGPPGSAKSTFCEAISTNRHFVKPMSVLKGLHSGYRGSGGNKGKDSSLIPRINGKTVIVKDADTIITSPNVNQILSDFRDIWDGTSRAEYKNFQSKEYTNIRTTFILAGTRTLRKLNRASAGDRFLDVIIYDREDQDLDVEALILKRSAASAFKQIRMESTEDGTTEDNTNPELMTAMQMTGGYVGWLRENAQHLVRDIECPDSILTELTYVGEMVGFLRSRPDKDADEDDHEVELATRLTKQFVRLAHCIAAVMNKSSIDDEVMSIVRFVANSTGRGIIHKIVQILYEHHESGTSVTLIAHRLSRSESMVRKYLYFMREVGMVQGKAMKSAGSGQGRGRQIWKLRPRIIKLFESILEWDMVEEDEED